MQKVILTVLLLCSLTLQAQFTTLGRIPASYTVVFIEPMSVLDYSNGPSLRLGAEYAFNRKWGVSCTIGQYFEQGYIIKGELKRYFQETETNRYFLSLQYVNSWHIHTVHDAYQKYDSSRGYSIEDPNRQITFTGEKHVHAITILFGDDIFIGSRWVFSPYMGLGVKFKTVETSLPWEELNKLYHYHESQAENFGFTPGRYTTLDVRLGFRFGRIITGGKRTPK